MMKHTRKFLWSVMRETGISLGIALLAGAMFFLIQTITFSGHERPALVAQAETKTMATHVIDYTAADGAPTEAYTDAGPVAMWNGGLYAKLSGTEDSEAGTWYIPTDRIEEIDP
jgi:hypothetical protein